MRKSKVLLGFYGGEGVDGVNGGNKTIKKNIHVQQNTCGEYVHDLLEAFHNVRKQVQNGMNFCSGAADSPGQRAPPKADPAKESKATDSC